MENSANDCQPQLSQKPLLGTNIFWELFCKGTSAFLNLLNQMSGAGREPEASGNWPF
jgi:hypothetical protein